MITLRNTLHHLLPWSRQDIDDGIGSVDQIVAMLHLEKQYYSLVHDYLTKPFTGAARREGIKESHRKMLCKWALPIIDHFKFDHKVAFVFTHFLDKATACLLQKTKSKNYVSHREYQLIAITSLYLAVKLHGQQVHTKETYADAKAVIVAVETFVSLGQEQGFTTAEVESKELEIVFDLNWHLHPPTPLCFLNLLVKLLPASWSSVYIQSDLTVLAFIFALAVFLTELTLIDTTCAFRFTASEIACAAIQCAMDALEYLLASKPSILQCTLEPSPREVGITLLERLGDRLSMTVEKIDEICPRLKDLFYSSTQSLVLPNHHCSLPEDLVTRISSQWKCRYDADDGLSCCSDNCLQVASETSVLIPAAMIVSTSCESETDLLDDFALFEDELGYLGADLLEATNMILSPCWYTEPSQDDSNGFESGEFGLIVKESSPLDVEDCFSSNDSIHSIYPDENTSVMDIAIMDSVLVVVDGPPIDDMRDEPDNMEDDDMGEERNDMEDDGANRAFPEGIPIVTDGEDSESEESTFESNRTCMDVEEPVGNRRMKKRRINYI